MEATEEYFTQARAELVRRCGSTLVPMPIDTPLASGREGIGQIGDMLRTALACIDALEDRVRELERRLAS